MKARFSRWLLYVLVIGLACPTGLPAQEHPSEHPKKAEHPKEHPTGKGAGVSMEDLGTAIDSYIKGEMTKGDGTWKVEDKEDKTTLNLTLLRVHKDKLAMTGPETYFACADLTNTDGHLYDLDVFMKGPDKDHLAVTEVSVHKKDGQERYTWMQESGVWKKEKVGKGAEHPKGEHPKKN